MLNRSVLFLRGDALMKENWIEGMPPVLPEKPIVLILGSIPGVKSLEKQQYYGNPRNHFWPIMASVFDEELPEDYESRIEWIKMKDIALWDSIGSCTREGSLDSKIRNACPNDIAALVQSHPSLERIICNGSKSWTIYKKYFEDTGILRTPALKMPSTSPVPGKYTKSLEEKTIEWKNALAPIIENR